MTIIHTLKKKVSQNHQLYIQLLFTASSFLAMVFLSNLFMNSIVHGRLIQNTETVLSFEKARVESELSDYILPLEIISGTVRDMILRGDNAGRLENYILEKSNNLKSTERYLQRFSGLFCYLETFPAEPVFISDNTYLLPEGYNPVERAWYEAALAADGKIATTLMYPDYVYDETVLIYSLCIYNNVNRRIGIIGLRIKVNPIGGEIVETALTQGGYGMLLSDDLVVLAHPNQDFVGKKIYDPAIPFSIFTEDLKNKTDFSERQFTSYRNESSVAFSRNLSNGWYLGFVAPKGPYYKSVTNMMLLLCALGTALAAVLSIVLIRVDAARTKSDLESRHKSAFLANMSHEIRTPMNAIIGMTTIGKKTSGVERKDYCFAKIQDASNHLLGVINDILDMSKIEANKFELSLEEFDFEKMLQQVVNVTNFRVEDKLQTLTVYIDRAVPKVLIGDDQRLAQIITNLLSNANKFTPEHGSISLAARFAGEENGIYTIQVSVSDTGIGISGEQQTKLFQSFEQAESGTTRKYGGTGLGLAISKNIVEMMGGRIWIESEEGKGSTFSFTFKVQRGEKSKPDILSSAVNWKNVRIMVVDDDSDVLSYFDEILDGFGLTCDTANSAEEALGLVERKGMYHVYFVDWKMPGIDGIQLSRELKAKSSGNTIVIMISAFEWSVIAEEAKNAGVDKFLSKPLFPSSIADVLSECLGKDEEEIEEAQTDTAGVFAGRHILLAEDVEINREIVQALLEPTQLDIDYAENGLEAVRMFSEAPEKYNVILMDLQMPVMDGYEATRRIRELEFASQTPRLSERPKSVPIIAMTANVFREDIEKCLEAGMDSHIGKPLDFNEVIKKLRTYMPN